MNLLKHLCITPDLLKQGACILFDSDKTVENVSYKITDADGKQAFEDSVSAENNKIFAKLPIVHLWTIEDPYLYTFSADITYSTGEAESVSDTFGMRSLSACGSDILLNGKPFYMRAVIRGTICHDHQNILDLPEEEFYAKYIRTAKTYGFNTIRFHSKIPPDACFKAADKLGMFIHIELRSDEETEYDNLEEMVKGIEVNLSNETIKNAAYRLMNHPSFMVYCIGNEIKHPGVNPRVREIARYIKEIDPSRLFIDTCAHGEFDRDYVEFDVQHMSYYYPFGKNADMFENTDNLLVYGSCTGLDTSSISENGDGKITRTIVPERPIIAHEVCHYTALRDFDALAKKFEKAGKEAPWWVEEEKKMIEAKGLTDLYPKMFKASKAFQLMSWKLALEGIRRSPILRGFHMLQFADTDRYENSNGVVDCFDEVSGVDAERFLRFNGDTVLLADIPVRAYFEGETVVISVLVSNYSQIEYGMCDFSYELIDTDTNEKPVTGCLKNLDIDKRGCFELVKLHITFPQTDKSRNLRLVTRLLSSKTGKLIENDWDIWCFENKPEKLNLSDCAFNLTRINALSRYKKLSGCPKNGEKLYVTDILDDIVFQELERGANVILFYRSPLTRHVRDRDAKADKYTFRTTWDRFKAVIWDRGTNYGGMINRPEAVKGFPHRGITDLQFARLIEDSDKIILDDFPVKVKPIFQEIDKCTRDRFDAYTHSFNLPELQYDRTLRLFSHIFEINAGAGKLIVTGLNFEGLGIQQPEVCGLFEALINYAKSPEFKPEASIGVNELREHLLYNSTLGPVRERMMTQFWQLNDTPVESLDYWNDSKKYCEEGDRITAACHSE